MQEALGGEAEAVQSVLASIALCALCYGLVLRLLPLEEDEPNLGLLPLPGLFFLAAVRPAERRPSRTERWFWRSWRKERVFS